MSDLAFEITLDGETETSTVEVTFDAVRFSLREMVRVEDALGPEAAELFMAGELPFTPKAVQALLWAKIVSQYPEVGIGDFDLPGAAFADFNETG